MVPSPNAATASRPSPVMFTAQVMSGTGFSHSCLPFRSNRRSDHSAPSRKRAPSGAIARLREISYCSSGRRLPFRVGVYWFFQSTISSPGASVRAVVSARIGLGIEGQAPGRKVECGR